MTTSSMQSPVAVELFSTSILSNHKVRNRHERYVSILQVKRIPFVYHDLASDENAKSRWRRTALDPQIPGLLVHNEWRGTFEEFEESVELGELDLFLRIDEERAKREAEDGIIPQPVDLSQQVKQEVVEEAPQPTLRKPSKHVVRTVPALAQPRQPSMNALAPALPMAAPSGESTVKRKGDHVEGFLQSLGITDLNLTEEELNEVLEAGQTSTESRNEKAERRNENRYQGLGMGTSSTQQAVPRTYVPSADAGTKPLRLAKMGNGRSQSQSASAPQARYNASQTSSRALAAEAQASVSSRSFSSAKLRDAVTQGHDLQEAISQTRLASNTDSAEQVVGREDIDELLASLGLDDIKMSDEEAQSFLLDGLVPEGTMSGGERLSKSGSFAERARNETAARNVARRAREKGYGSNSDSDSSRSPSIEQDTSVIIKPDETPKAVSVDAFTGEKAEVKEDTDKTSSTVAASDNTTSTIAAKTLQEDDEPADLDRKAEDVSSEKAEAVAEDSAPATEALTQQVDVVAEAGTGAILKSDDQEKGASDNVNEKDASEKVDGNDALEEADGKGASEKADESTPRQKLADLPPVDKTVDSTLTIKEGQGEHSADSASTARLGQIDEADLGVDDGSPARGPPADAPDSLSDTAGTSPGLEKALDHPPPLVRNSARQSQLQLDSSFASLAWEIQTGEQSKEAPAASGTILDEPVQAVLQSPRGSPTVAPTSPASTTGPLEPISPRSSSMAPSPSASSSLKIDASKSQAMRSPSASSNGMRSGSTNRRRAIDIQRPNVSSPTSETSFSPPLSAARSPSLGGMMRLPSATSFNGRSGSLGRRTSNQSDCSTSPEASLKSPRSSSGKKLFSIGRRSKDKKGRRTEEEEDEDIPSTIDPTLVESRSSASGQVGTLDRSQKTLSVILREADEAMSGAGGEDDDDDNGYGGYGDDDDDGGAFDFDIDLEGDDGIAVEGR